jgi:type VI secretion system protein ImpH
VWDPQARFRVTLGPLAWREFVAFLPDSDGWRHLVELTRFFVGEEFSFDVRPRLRKDQVPAAVLGGGPNSRLGWATWLRTEPLTEDTSRPVFDAHVVHLATT